MKINNLVKKLGASIFIGLLFLVAVPAISQAQDSSRASVAAGYLDPSGECTKDNPTCKLTNFFVNGDPASILGLLAGILLGFAGAFAFFFVIWGGYQLLTSAGNPEKIKKGKSTLTWAILGLTAAVGSYFILSAVIQALQTASKQV